MRDPRAGGSIYIWTLGANKGAHAIAREFGHEDVWRVLMDRTPEAMKLAVACELGDEDLVTQLLAARPDLAATLTPDDRRRLPDAAQDNNTAAVRLHARGRLAAPTRAASTTPRRCTGRVSTATPEMARLLLEHGAPVNLKGDDFDGTPLDWALHGVEHREALQHRRLRRDDRRPARRRRPIRG